VVWACLGSDGALESVGSVGFPTKDNVSAYFVFTCKKARRDAPGAFERERLRERVQKGPELIYVAMALAAIDQAPVSANEA